MFFSVFFWLNRLSKADKKCVCFLNSGIRPIEVNSMGNGFTWNNLADVSDTRGVFEGKTIQIRYSSLDMKIIAVAQLKTLMCFKRNVLIYYSTINSLSYSHILSDCPWKACRLFVGGTAPEFCMLYKRGLLPLPPAEYIKLRSCTSVDICRLPGCL